MLLYASGERHFLLHVRKKWKQINPEESTPKVEAKSVWRSATSPTNSGTKRLQENMLRYARLKNRSLEHTNMELKNIVKELETRIELMSKIMKELNKLSFLMTRLQGLCCSNETKVVCASAPCVQS